jgi:hypothetical protein
MNNVAYIAVFEDAENAVTAKVYAHSLGFGVIVTDEDAGQVVGAKILPAVADAIHFAKMATGHAHAAIGSVEA